MRTYDSVVLGTGIVGCTTAAMLAKSGKRVMIIDSADAPGGAAASVELGATRLTGLPSCCYGFEEGGAWRFLLKELGITDVIFRDHPGYQVALPDRRVCVYPDPLETLQELRREYPSDAVALEKFYRDCMALTTRIARSKVTAFRTRRRRSDEYLEQYHFSKELLSFFTVSSYFFFGTSLGNISLAELALLIATPPKMIEGGVGFLAGRLLDAVRRKGGDCVLGIPWPEVLLRKSRVHGILLGQEQIGCRTLILNTAVRKQEKAVVALLDEDVIPVGMFDTVLSIADYERPGDMAVFTLSNSSNAESVPAGARMLHVCFRGDNGTETAVSVLVGRVASLIPFVEGLEEKIVVPDVESRAVRLPPGVVEKAIRKGREGLEPVQYSLKHLFLTDDSTFGIGRSINVARSVIAKVS